jgi:hypothetical protein
LEAEEARVRTNGQGAESDCASAMAEAERVLRELSVVTRCMHINLSLGRAMPDRLPLDPRPGLRRP